MMKKQINNPYRVALTIGTTCVLGLLLSAGPALAQSNTDQSKKQPQAKHAKKHADDAARMAGKRCEKTIAHAAKKMHKHETALQDAITMAEKETGGTAISARLEFPLDKLRFAVLCTTEDGHLKRVTVDGQKQKVLETARVTHAGRRQTGSADWTAGVAQFTVFRLVRHSDVVDCEVTNGAGQTLGDIEAFAIDPVVARVRYAALESGGDWGTGGKLLAVPLMALESWATEPLELDVTRKEIEHADGFQDDDWPLQANYRWEADLEAMASREYQLVRDEQRIGLKRNQDRAVEPAMAKKSTEIVGMTVVNRTGEELGTVSDLYIDPDRSRVCYAVIEHGGTLGIGATHYAVPWDSITWDSVDGLVLDVSPERLKNAPRCTEANVVVQTDPDWVTGVYDYFSVTPYWVTVETKTTGQREM